MTSQPYPLKMHRDNRDKPGHSPETQYWRGFSLSRSSGTRPICTGTRRDTFIAGSRGSTDSRAKANLPARPARRDIEKLEQSSPAD